MQEELESFVKWAAARLDELDSTKATDEFELSNLNMQISAASALLSGATAALALYVAPPASATPMPQTATSQPAAVIRTPNSQWHITAYPQE